MKICNKFHSGHLPWCHSGRSETTDRISQTLDPIASLQDDIFKAASILLYEKEDVKSDSTVNYLPLTAITEDG